MYEHHSNHFTHSMKYFNPLCISAISHPGGKKGVDRPLSETVTSTISITMAFTLYTLTHITWDRPNL